MIWFPDLSTIVSVGGITIKWYAFTLVLGCIVGYLYLSQAMKAHGYKQAVSDDLLVLILVSGIVGGRIFWVLENMKNYSMYAWYVFAIGDGGIFTGNISCDTALWQETSSFLPQNDGCC